MQLNPYLHFNGQCTAAFAFYAQILGGTVVCRLTHGESPMADETPPDWQDAVLHSVLNVGDTMLLGSDTPPEAYQRPLGFFVALQFDDPAEAERVFGTLSDGGTVTMPLGETFWAVRFGMLVDRFGIPWIVNCAKDMGCSRVE